MPKSAFVYTTDTPPSFHQLVENGIRLWHEEAAIRSTQGNDIGQLWDECEDIMNPKRSAQWHEAMVHFFAHGDPLRHTLVEASFSVSDIRKHLSEQGPTPARAHEMMAAAMAGMAPRSWRSRTPYPHRDLFIAAFYLIESKQLLNTNAIAALPSCLAQAYYYLGMGSSAKTSRESASEAARAKGLSRSDDLRQEIVKTAHALPHDGSIKTTSAAIASVVAAFREGKELQTVLLSFDQRTHKKSEGDSRDTLALALDRLEKNLRKWAAKKSTYLDIVEAFAPFKRRRAK